MESHKLNKLAEKFWKGECSAEEEQWLMDALKEEKHSGKQSELHAYSLYLEEERAEQLDEDFDAEIMDMISQPKTRLLFPRQIMRWAAAIALILGISFALVRILEPNQVEENIATIEFTDTYDDPELAYQEVKKALMMVSSNMNNGIKQTTYIGEFHKAKEKISGEQAGE